MWECRKNYVLVKSNVCWGFCCSFSVWMLFLLYDDQGKINYLFYSIYTHTWMQDVRIRNTCVWCVWVVCVACVACVCGVCVACVCGVCVWRVCVACVWRVCGVCGVYGVVWCVWCGVVWCGVVWCGVVWCGVVWCGVVWCVAVCCGVCVSAQVRTYMCSCGVCNRKAGRYTFSAKVKMRRMKTRRRIKTRSFLEGHHK